MGLSTRKTLDNESHDSTVVAKASDSQVLSGRTSSVVWSIRIYIIILALLGIYFSDYMNTYISHVWQFLQSSWIFNSVYFETWWATFCYAWIIPVYPFTLHFVRSLDKYKINPSVTYVHQSVVGMIKEAVYYMSPLMLLDTFIVKKYPGVEPDVWETKREHLIQTTRALPINPPTLYQTVFQLIASIVLYDALFFVLHLALHKNAWFYKNIHALHHDHDVMHAHVTNQLTVIERIALILSANFALKVFSSHPLTRVIFVPVFIFLLVDNHAGYDLPFGLHRILPFGIISGPVKHYQHHLHGARHYQPFFTYLDYLLEKSKKYKYL